jgi:ElaB/YqjD/DUF883 family membrane-anchored ribosome-binding protein
VENQQLTSADKTPEQIQEEMAQTRDSLTGKVAALENQVVGTVQTAADTLTGTVESVKSLITTAPAAVSDTVKQAAQAMGETMKRTFDVSGHVREHPLTSVCVSMLAGGITGFLLSGGRKSHSSNGARRPVADDRASTPREPPREPGVLDEFLALIGRKVRTVAENVIDTATEAVNKNVRSDVPKLVDAATEMAADHLTPGESRSRYAPGFTG